MSRDEVIANIGTIARSGTREFLRAVREQKGQLAPELIGQFGVGFYSSFMVADRITLVTHKAGEATATRWESPGDGYELAEAERDAAGTTVTLHLKPKDDIPSKAPFDLFMRDGKRGVHLYVKRVFIMDDWEALLPPWLRFVRGVVASDDLSLNVSREILQKDRQIQAIRKHLTRRLLAALKDLPRDKYVTFWPEFGAVLNATAPLVQAAGLNWTDRPKRHRSWRSRPTPRLVR
jgi:HSP90 family molecular chaperone